MAKFIIFRNVDYYPYVLGEYDNLKEALLEYNNYTNNETYNSHGEWFLCEVIMKCPKENGKVNKESKLSNFGLEDPLKEVNKNGFI